MPTHNHLPDCLGGSGGHGDGAERSGEGADMPAPRNMNGRGLYVVLSRFSASDMLRRNALRALSPKQRAGLAIIKTHAKRPSGQQIERVRNFEIPS